MEETFLCFESDAALFLVPLALVYRIVPGKARTEDGFWDGDIEIPVTEAHRLWGKEGAGDGEYIVLLNGNDGLYGLLVSNVLGVYLVDSREEKEIPAEARGEHNAWLKKAVYLETLDRWAFILEERMMLEIKGL